MAVTVTLNLTEMYDFDSTTDTSASQGGNAVDTDAKVEGTGSIACELRTAGRQWMKYTRPSGTWDLSNQHVYVWVNCIFAGQLATKASGGMGILLGDGTNQAYHYLEGSDTYSGGWICLVCDTSQSFDWNTGSNPTLTAITEVGVYINIATGFKNVESTWMDIARYGDGITITSDSSCDLDDIIAVSENTTNASGIIRKSNGVFYVQGKLRFGDGSGTGSLTFADTSQIIVFPDKHVSSTHYGIIVQGNGTGTTSFQMGTLSGGRGISGCVIKANNVNKPFSFTATDTDVSTMKLYGCLFYRAGDVSLPVYSTGRQVISCTFEESGTVIASTCTVTYCNFINSVDEALQIDSASFNVTYCNFITCATGFETTITSSLSFYSLSFTGCTYDGLNSSGSAVTVNYDSGCSPAPSSYDPAGSTITYQTSVTLTVRKVKTGNEPTDYVRVAIYRVSDMTEILNTDASVADDQNPTYYKASTTWTQSGITVRVRCREKGWLPFEVDVVIPATGLDLTAVWIPDPNYQ